MIETRNCRQSKAAARSLVLSLVRLVVGVRLGEERERGRKFVETTGQITLTADRVLSIVRSNTYFNFGNPLIKFNPNLLGQLYIYPVYEGLHI